MRARPPGLGFSGPARRSLSLRPDDSLTIRSMALSVGFRVLISLHPATRVTGGWLFPRRVCLPPNTPAFAGRTRRWPFFIALRHLMANGLTGDPTAPVTGIGGATKRNSYTPSLAQSAARASD